MRGRIVWHVDFIPIRWRDLDDGTRLYDEIRVVGVSVELCEE